MHLYLNRIIPSITNLGPGKRIGLWLQGCSLRCRGCMSPELFDKDERYRRDLESIFQEMIHLSPGHDGVTVSGGEPMEQSLALGVLMEKIRRHTRLDLMLYSGYTREEIQQSSQEMCYLLDQIDILIDGRYHHDLPTRKLWRGSANQRMHLLSERARGYRDYLEAEYGSRRPIQVNMEPQTGLVIIGIPESGFRGQLEKKMREKGVRLIKTNLPKGGGLHGE